MPRFRVGFLYPLVLDPDLASVLVPFELEMRTSADNGFDAVGGPL